QSIGAEQQRPEQQRSLLPRPQGSELIMCRQVVVAVVQNVSNREVVLKSRYNKHERGEENARAHGNSGAPGSFTHALGAWTHEGYQSCDKRIPTQRQGEQ